MSGLLSDLIDDLIHEADVAALPEWDGAPLHFTIDYYSPAESLAAWERWQAVKGHESSIPISHMWHPVHWGLGGEIAGHQVSEWAVDLRCWGTSHRSAKYSIHWEQHQPVCYCVGDLLTKIICETCSTHFIGYERDAVEQMHGHIFPGWRGLPALPKKYRGKMGGTKMTAQLEEWFEQNYPEAFRIPGAPILTTRGSLGTRHVPGYSPYGGYDLSI